MSPFCRLSSLRRQHGGKWDPCSSVWTHIFLRGLKAQVMRKKRSVCNSLGCLSMKVKLGSCCSHLRKNIKRQIILESDSDQSYQREIATMWEKLTLFSSFLGGGGMVSFAGDSRSTVEHAKSGHSCGIFYLFFFNNSNYHTFKRSSWNSFWLLPRWLISRKNNWIELISNQLFWAQLPIFVAFPPHPLYHPVP